MSKGSGYSLGLTNALVIEEFFKFLNYNAIKFQVDKLLLKKQENFFLSLAQETVLWTPIKEQQAWPNNFDTQMYVTDKV